MSALQAFLRFFFKHLYTTMAWSYDLVAWIVSFGQWNQWIEAVLPFAAEEPALEVGFGPGHLQLLLAMNRVDGYGVDPSPQMCRRGWRRLASNNFPSRLARARAQQLPFPRGSMGTILATFPTEYVFDPASVQEFWRVLKRDGILSFVLMADLSGNTPFERFLHWLFRVTGETWELDSTWLKPLQEAGFEAKIETGELARSTVKIVVARKMIPPAQERTGIEKVQ